MICSKILSVSKAFVRFRPAVRRGRLSPLWDAGGMTKNCPREQDFQNFCRLAAEMKAGSATLGCRGNDKKLPACARLPEFLQTCGGDEGGLSPPLSYRRGRSHRILRKGAQACGNELLWRRGI